MARKPNYAFERNAKAKAKAQKREAKRAAKLATKTTKEGEDSLADGTEAMPADDAGQEPTAPASE